jgi:hypothetical protein
MEGILTELTIGPGVLMAALALLVFALEGILLGSLADKEKAGKRFFWTESSPSEPEQVSFLPSNVGMRRAA